MDSLTPTLDQYSAEWETPLKPFKDRHGNPIHPVQLAPFYWVSDQVLDVNLTMRDKGWRFKIEAISKLGSGESKHITAFGTYDYCVGVRKEYGNGQITLICPSGFEIYVA